ncbi:MAG: hypothetical protein IPM66_20375 [Acidobacteriota bacterium]|nr:MAG: hypothetical protein IPM66_20375 [Acidobacteriota bacterium]
MDKHLVQIEPRLDCRNCGAAGARLYLEYSFHDRMRTDTEQVLCVRCARAKRGLRQHPDERGITRRELIQRLDAFSASSGVFEICAKCHRQGTGCCPSTCRVMGDAGCDPANRYGKTVFCSAFICGALLNAISEVDPEIGRELRWVKRELGPPEYHLFEMLTRAPAGMREHEYPLALPESYPAPEGLERGGEIRRKLIPLTEEILEIRRTAGARTSSSAI